MIRKDGTKVKAIMRDFTLGEISAVDRPAQKGATVAIMKRDDQAVEKFMGSMALTTMAAGHSHLITMGGGDYVRRAGSTDYTDGHTHPWVMDEAGNITVGFAQGHNHGIEVLTKGEMTLDQLEAFDKRTFSSKERAAAADSGAAMADGSYPIKSTQDLKNAIQAFGRAKNKAAVATHIKRRAKALGAMDILPTSGALADALGKADDSASNHDTAAEPIGTHEDHSMTPEEQKAADAAAAAQKAELEKMTKRAERAEAVASLSDAHRAFFKGLNAEQQDAFLAASEFDRNAQITKAQEANQVVYKAKDGTEYRKSDDPRLVTMAKSMDEERAKREQAEQAAQKADLEKRANELTHIPGDLNTRMSLLKGIDTLPAEERTKALEALKAQNTALGKSFQRVGTSAAPAADDALDPLDAMATDIAKRDNLTFEQAYNKALNTPEGQKLYNQHVAKRQGASV